MGCDIHLSVERKNPTTGNWDFVSPEGLAPQDDWDRKRGFWDWCGGRNYGLFSILANVRNGFGFAGVDTGDGYNPIANPKGIPEDASPEYLAQVKRWEGDGHSHSFFTVRELLDYDWNQTTRRRGLIDPLEFAFMLQRDVCKPFSWCGGSNAAILTFEEMEKYITSTKFIQFLEAEVTRWAETSKDPKRAEYLDYDLERFARLSALLEVQRLSHTPQVDHRFHKDNYMAKYEWDETYADVASQFLANTLPALEKLGDPENVRIVFYFDN